MIHRSTGSGVNHVARHTRTIDRRKQLPALEKEIGFDIKVIKGTVRRTGVTTGQDAEALHAQLKALAKLAAHLVVIFDEFQARAAAPTTRSRSSARR